VSPDGKHYKVAQVENPSSVSSDGRFLLYTDWRALNVNVRDLKTGEDRRLIDGWFPKISPDGKRVAYAALNEEGFEELRIVSLEGSKPQVVYNNGKIGWIEPKEWSPDGKQILAVLLTNDRTKNKVATVSVADSSLRVLKELTDWRTPGKMSFSPDGRHIAYEFPSNEDSPELDIFVLWTDSARQVLLVDHPGDDLLLGWTPDGKEVLFASDEAGTWDAWLVKVTNGKPRGAPKLVKRDLGSIWEGLGFAPDGSYYYGVFNWVNDVYVSAFDPATGQLQPPRKLVSHVGFDTSIEWSPDGQHLAYVSGHGYELYSFVLGVRSFVPEGERRLRPKMTRFGSHAFEPHWSPNSGFLLAQGRDRKGPQGRQGLYRINAQSGEVTPAVPGEENGGLLEWPVWCPDGKVIFTRWKRWPGRTIVIRDLKSGRQEELYEVAAPVGIARLAVSVDGQRLAFVQWDSKTGMTALVVMPLSGGEVREIVKLPSQELSYSQPLFALAWTPDSRHIIYAPTMAGQKPRFELWRISAEGGEPQNLGLTMQGLLPYGLSVHPDGRRIAFTAGTEPRSEVWVLKGLLPALKAARPMMR